MINRGTAFCNIRFSVIRSTNHCVCLVFFNDDDIEPSDVVIDKPSEKWEKLLVAIRLIFSSN